MPIEDLGEQISPGVFYLRIYNAGGGRVDRFIVKPGTTVPFHGNAANSGYKLVACTRLKFLSLTEDGRISEYRRMEPGEQLIRPAGFRHTLVNTSDEDFVVLKMWPWPPE